MSDSASDPPSSKPRRGPKRRPPAERDAAPRKRRRRASSPSKPKARRRPKKAAVAAPTAPPAPSGWRNPRTRLGASGIVLIAGLVMVSLGPSELGAGLTLLGAMAFFYSIHRYGRLGADQGGELL